MTSRVSQMPTAAVAQPVASMGSRVGPGGSTVTPASATAAAIISPPSHTHTTSHAKSLLLHWEDNSALDSSASSALTQLGLALAERHQATEQREDGAATRPQTAPAQQQPEQKSTAEADAPTSLLEALVRQQQQRTAAAASKRTPRVKAEVSDLSRVDTSVVSPFSDRPMPEVTPTSTAAPILSHAAIYALLLNAQLYTSTPEYVQHLTRAEATASQLQLDSGFRVADPARNSPASAPAAAAHLAHIQYYLQLRSTSSVLQRLLSSTQSLLASSGQLLDHFSAVFDKTNSVREECSALLAEQQGLAAATFKFNYHLSYFVEYDSMQAKLTDTENQPTLARFMRDYNDLQALTNAAQVSGAVDAVSSNPMQSTEFSHILTSLDNCIDYMKTNADFLDATAARVRYEKLHATILRNVRNFVRTNLDRAVRVAKEQPTAHVDPASATTDGSALGLYQTHAHWMRIFVQLRSLAHALKPLMLEMEHRAFVNEGGIFGAGFSQPTGSIAAPSTNGDATAIVSTQPSTYKELLLDCYRIYSERRHALLYQDLQRHLTDLAKSGRPLSQLIRSACLSWIELCTLESQLFVEFFSANHHSINTLNDLLTSFCSLLYTTLRPIIIQNLDMDALAEVITILQDEIIGEQVKARGNKGFKAVPPSGAASSSSAGTATADLFHTSSPLYSFSKSIQRLIADVQERLIYRAQLYIRDTIQKYQHTQEDLNYPQKLQQPTSPTAESLPPPPLDPTSMMQPSLAPTAATPASREHLFSTWHPALERTLMCLSKLFRCVEPSVFKYLAQEAMSVCTTILLDASARITAAHAATDASRSDGGLFLIKHFLIMREQITPFAGVEFSVTQKDLDFSHMKDVLPNIFSSVGKWSSFLDLVQNSAPRMRENKMDAKKLLEAQLKSACEQLIASQTQYLIGSLLEFFNQMGAHQQTGEAQHQPHQFKAKLVDIVARMTGLTPDQARAARTTGEAPVAPMAAVASPFDQQLRALIQQTSLYLANPSTERVICKPIQRTVGEVLEQLRFFVQTHFPRGETTTLGATSSAAAASGPSQEDLLTEYLEESIAALEASLRASFA